MKSEHADLWAVLFGFACLVLAVSLVGRQALVASFLVLILAVSVTTTLLMFYWRQSWLLEPRHPMVAWLSGGFLLFLLPWIAEELGWFVWSLQAESEGGISPDSSPLTVFQYTLSPLLKSLAASGAASLAIILSLLRSQTHVDQWARPVRRVAALSMCLSALAIVVVGIVSFQP